MKLSIALEEELKVLDLVLWLNNYCFVLLDCFPLFLNFLLLWLNFLFGTWGRPRKLKVFYKWEAGDMGGICPPEGPTGSCMVSLSLCWTDLYILDIIFVYILKHSLPFSGLPCFLESVFQRAKDLILIESRLSIFPFVDHTFCVLSKKSCRTLKSQHLFSYAFFYRFQSSSFYIQICDLF